MKRLIINVCDFDRFGFCDFCQYRLNQEDSCPKENLSQKYFGEVDVLEIWNEEFDIDYYRKLGVCYKCFQILNQNKNCPDGHM